jgi:hypothetical protein
MKEIVKMGEMPLELEQVLEETGWLARYEAKNRARWEAEAEETVRRKEGIEIARNALAEGATPEFVRKITGLPAEVITTL